MNRAAYLLVVVLSFAGAGCKQAVGDRCVVDSDCGDGLICLMASGATQQTGGTCQMPATNDAGLPDLAPMDAPMADRSAIDSSSAD